MRSAERGKYGEIVRKNAIMRKFAELCEKMRTAPFPPFAGVRDSGRSHFPAPLPGLGGGGGRCLERGHGPGRHALLAAADGGIGGGVRGAGAGGRYRQPPPVHFHRVVHRELLQERRRPPPLGTHLVGARGGGAAGPTHNTLSCYRLPTEWVGGDFLFVGPLGFPQTLITSQSVIPAGERPPVNTWVPPDLSDRKTAEWRGSSSSLQIARRAAGVPAPQPFSRPPEVEGWGPGHEGGGDHVLREGLAAQSPELCVVHTGALLTKRQGGGYTNIHKHNYLRPPRRWPPACLAELGPFGKWPLGLFG